MKTVKVYKTADAVEFHIKGSSRVYGFSDIEERFWIEIAHQILDNRKQYGSYSLSSAYFKEEPKKTMLVAEVFAN